MFKPPAAVQAEYQDFRSGPRPHDCWFQFQMAVATNYLTKLNQVVHWAQNSCPSSGPSASPAQMGHGGLANKTSQWWFMMMIIIMMCYSVWHLTCTHVTLVTCDTFIQVINCSAALDSALSGSEVTEARPGPARAFNSVSLQWVSPGNKFGDSDTLRLSKSPSPRHGKFNQVGDRGLAPCHVVDGDGEGHSPLGSTHGVWRFVPPSRPGTGFELKSGDAWLHSLPSDPGTHLLIFARSRGIGEVPPKIDQLQKLVSGLVESFGGQHWAPVPWPRAAVKDAKKANRTGKMNYVQCKRWSCKTIRKGFCLKISRTKHHHMSDVYIESSVISHHILCFLRIRGYPESRIPITSPEPIPLWEINAV